MYDEIEYKIPTPDKELVLFIGGPLNGQRMIFMSDSIPPTYVEPKGLYPFDTEDGNYRRETLVQSRGEGIPPKVFHVMVDSRLEGKSIETLINAYPGNRAYGIKEF